MYFSFQDVVSLYLIMEFLPGGVVQGAGSYLEMGSYSGEFILRR